LKPLTKYKVIETSFETQFTPFLILNNKISSILMRGYYTTILKPCHASRDYKCYEKILGPNLKIFQLAFRK